MDTEKSELTTKVTDLESENATLVAERDNLKRHRERLEGRVVALNKRVVDLTSELTLPHPERLYFERDISSLQSAVGQEDSHHESVLICADRLSAEVDHLKFQLEILNCDSARGLAAFSKIEKIRQEDSDAGSFLQVVAGNAERLLDPTNHGFWARPYGTLS